MEQDKTNHEQQTRNTHNRAAVIQPPLYYQIQYKSVVQEPYPNKTMYMYDKSDYEALNNYISELDWEIF